MNRNIGMRIPGEISKEGIEEVAIWASRIGLDILDVPRLTSKEKEACDRVGIDIGSVDIGNPGLLSVDSNKRKTAVQEMKKQMSDISRLGGRVLFMVILPEDHTLPRQQTFEIWKETFPDIVSHAEKNDLYIAIEGWPGPAPYYPTLGCTPEMLRAMFEVIPSKHFGMTYDPSHLVRLGIDYLRVLNEFGERINHCHGKDTELLPEELYEFGVIPSTFGEKYEHSEGSWRYTIPGHGEVDWGKVAVRLERLGYQGPISIELEDHQFSGSIEAERQGIEKSIEHLRKYFK